MSHIIFGCFNSDTIGAETIYEIKTKLYEEGLYLWFNDEMDFYPDVLRMIKEQKGKGESSYAITSQEQRYNSDDLLFPYDKYTNDQLFADKTREYFSECCKNNLNILFRCLYEMIQRIQPKNFEVFVTEGYDCNFSNKNVDLEEMEADILKQILTSFSIESCIYQIKV